MSLSRFQLVLWTIVILSGLLAIALANLVFAPTASPLSIAIPSQIWVVMGISTTSLVGSSLILGSKTGTAPDPDEMAATVTSAAKQEGIAETNLSNNGVILVKSTPGDANWADLLRGEETGNGDYLDMGKVQMFFFTLILVLAYAIAIGTELGGTGSSINAFPQFDQSMVALLAISHGGYLANKAIPHSKPA